MSEVNITVVEVVKYLDDVITKLNPDRKMFDFLDLGKHIRYINRTPHDNGNAIIFDIYAPAFKREVSLLDQVIKVGSDGMRIFKNDENKGFSSHIFYFTLTEEEFFQNSLINDYGDITFETICSCKKILQYVLSLK